MTTIKDLSYQISCLFQEILIDSIDSKHNLFDSSFETSHVRELLQDDLHIQSPDITGASLKKKKIASVPIPEQFNSIYYYIVLNQCDTQEPEPTKDVPVENPVVDELSNYVMAQLFTDVEEIATPMPQKPYYKEISKMIALWATKNEVPVKFTKMYGLEEVEDDTLRLQSITPKVVHLKDIWLTSSKEIRRESLLNIINDLKVRGLLTLLRVRKTKGSIDHFPPSIRELVAAFNLPNTPSKPLTTGARALSKHCIRSKDGWWGDDRGSDSLKNKKAIDVLLKVFRNAVWLNIHLLPHDVRIVEIRQTEGFGARWSHDASMFRGFLEPQMENGHEIGWIH